MRSKRLTRSVFGKALSLFFLLVLGAFTALPFYYSVINAFKPVEELFLFPPRFMVYNPTWSNFTDIIRVQAEALVPLERYVFNTVFTTLAGTVIYVLIASMAAYPLSKRQFKGQKLLKKVIVSAILFRPEVAALPQYILLSKAGLIDGYGSLILPSVSGSFGVFLMMQFISGFPDEVLEAARIDGCSERGVFFRIVFPSVKPAWLTLIIFTVISLWNQTGAQFVYSESLKLLPVMVTQLSAAGIVRSGVTAALSLLLMLPPMIIFLLAQGAIVETMAHSGIKE
ncbi:MAG: carbohydrate ABC transporter permease [Oscillospiraceae bacterium]|jgi:ABC-type glycerol-3-phosphate transport system permease component|nr:carbohydrate ABC transporter permease [Oscillospiraceae bacterium]